MPGRHESKRHHDEDFKRRNFEMMIRRMARTKVFSVSLNFANKAGKGAQAVILFTRWTTSRWFHAVESTDSTPPIEQIFSSNFSMELSKRLVGISWTRWFCKKSMSVYQMVILNNLFSWHVGPQVGAFIDSTPTSEQITSSLRTISLMF